MSNVLDFMPVIRTARSADAHAVESLYRQLVKDINVRVAESQVRALESDGRTRLLVCEVNGRVRGTILIGLCMDAMYGGQPFAVVENLVVQRESSRDPRCTGVASGSRTVLPRIGLLEDDAP